MTTQATVEKLNVVILYERLAYASKAMATSLHLMRELAGEFAPDIRLWRVDVALAPAFAAEAEREIAAADVIMMAVNGRQPCPPAFQRWKDGTGHRGGQPPRAIIALMEASDEPIPEAGSWNNLLRSTATQIHSEVFVCEPPGTAVDQSLLSASPPQAVAVNIYGGENSAAPVAITPPLVLSAVTKAVAATAESVLCATR